MPKIELNNIPVDIYNEWLKYANLAGLPVEYMILEAVTHSVRSDRLGAMAAEHLRNLRVKRTQKDIKKASTVVNTTNETPLENEEGDVVIPQQMVEKHVDLDSMQSAESLEDCTPTHV